LDAEMAQMEMEELLMEMENSKPWQEQAKSVAAALTIGGGGSIQAGAGAAAAAAANFNDAHNMAQLLNVKNTWLREALMQLRKQLLVYKIDLLRQLRSKEKDVKRGQGLGSTEKRLSTVSHPTETSG
jgi:hypothetical protein